MLLNGEDVSDTIRLPEVSLLASRVSALPVVRAFLLDMQRSLARTHSVVMDGRDICSYVLPDATHKFFVTAEPEVRAARRYTEYAAAGKLNVACCITVAGFVLALSGLCLLLRGQLAMGIFVLTLASVADLLDGFTARKLGLVSAYGQSLDSLSDTISFVAAPAVILMWFGHFRPIWVVAGLVYAVCGVLRLNYFEHNPAPGYFIGVSSPIASGLLIMPFYALTFLFRVEAGWLTTLYPFYALAVGLAMIGGFKVKKYSFTNAAIGLCCYVIAVAGLVKSLL